MGIQVRQGSDRFRTDAQGRSTWHSFSFGSHYDPDQIGFGSMLAHNDERLPPGTGYADHPHANLEIVSFVVSGALRHTSTVGSESSATSRIVGPGEVQRLSAGSGVVHAEVADQLPTRFVQTWIRPAEPGRAPSYATAPAADSGSAALGLVPLAGGDAPIGIGAPARLFLAECHEKSPLRLPDAPLLHVFVLDGELGLGDADGPVLQPEDQARIVDEGGRLLAGAGRALVWALTRVPGPGRP